MTRKTLLSTYAKRKAIAKVVSRLVSETMGIDCTLKRGKTEFDRDEYRFRLERIETERGPVRHVDIEVCPRGVNIHTQFEFAMFAPIGANEYSGKWNHYVWPDHDDTREEYVSGLEITIPHILSRVVPIDATRADCPSMLDLWEVERAKFAKECAERRAKEESTHAI